MYHTLSVLSQDHPGILMRIAALIYRRDYNIVSLSVAQTEEAGISRFSIVVDGEERICEQIRKQLEKLMAVISVTNLTKEGNTVERYLKLIKVKAPQSLRAGIFQTADVFRCRVVDLGGSTVTLEVTGSKSKIDACVKALQPFGILETAGSGQVAMARSGFEE